MSEKPEIPPKRRPPGVRRMDWPNAIVVIALASVVCWLVVATLFVGVTGQNDANPFDSNDIDMAPASGPPPSEQR